MGEILNIDGTRFKGSFKDDLYHGFGVQVYPNGIVFAGEWEAGKVKSKLKQRGNQIPKPNRMEPGGAGMNN
jgi:hypothetical protein